MSLFPVTFVSCVCAFVCAFVPYIASSTVSFHFCVNALSQRMLKKKLLHKPKKILKNVVLYCSIFFDGGGGGDVYINFKHGMIHATPSAQSEVKSYYIHYKHNIIMASA